MRSDDAWLKESGIIPSSSDDTDVNIQRIARNRCRKLIWEFLFTITCYIHAQLWLAHTVDWVFGVAWNESLDLCWNSDKDFIKVIDPADKAEEKHLQKEIFLQFSNYGSLALDCDLVTVEL